MKTVETTLVTTAIYDDSKSKRYLLKKTWDNKKKSLGIIMYAPSEASGVELDTTTMLVLNNASRLGFGSVSIVNLFATLDDFTLSSAEDNDKENTKVITSEAKLCDTVVYAAGVGKSKNKTFAKRQEQVLLALKPFEKKLFCLTNKENTAKLQHPLSPAVRVWTLLPLKITDVITQVEKASEESKK